MNEQQFLLANAYLDGELTDEERRIAEADPVVMAEVDGLVALQSELRAVEPPSGAAREAAIAAAMTEFGRMSTPTAATAATAAGATTPVVPYRPRPAYGRFLAIAAAVVGVGVLGVVIANVPGGDDDAGGEETNATEEPGVASDRAIVESDEPAMDAAPAADDMAADQPAEEPAEMAAEEPAAEAAIAAETDVAADQGDDAGDGEGGAAVPGNARDLPITSPDELGAFGADLIVRADEGRLGAIPNSACEASVFGVGFLEVDGAVNEVLVAVESEQQLVTAIDPDTCDILETAPLPR